MGHKANKGKATEQTTYFNLKPLFNAAFIFQIAKLLNNILNFASLNINFKSADNHSNFPQLTSHLFFHH